MYAIIREGNGNFYTSMVFGYYKQHDETDYKNSFYIVLDKAKKTLIKQPIFQKDTKYLIIMVLITDANDSNWNMINNYEGSVNFLPTKELPSLIDNNDVSTELIKKCIDLDSSYHYEEIRKIVTQEDIRDLEWVSGGFHDAYISKVVEDENQLYLLFDGTWGCKIEVWFDGEVSYDISSRNLELYDPYWSGSTITIKDGFIYLIDEDNVLVENINSNHCWFKAKNMKYRVIPK